MPKILGLSHRRAVPLTIPGFLLVRTRVLFQHPLQPDPIATMYTALGQMRLVGSRTVRGHQKWERHQEAEKTGMPAMNSCSVHGTFHQFGMPLFGSDAPNWGTTKTAQTEPWKMVIETGARDWRLWAVFCFEPNYIKLPLQQSLPKSFANRFLHISASQKSLKRNLCASHSSHLWGRCAAKTSSGTNANIRALPGPPDGCGELQFECDAPSVLSAIKATSLKKRGFSQLR